MQETTDFTVDFGPDAESFEPEVLDMVCRLAAQLDGAIDSDGDSRLGTV